GGDRRAGSAPHVHEVEVVLPVGDASRHVLEQRRAAGVVDLHTGRVEGAVAFPESACEVGGVEVAAQHREAGGDAVSGKAAGGSLRDPRGDVDVALVRHEVEKV